MNLPFVLPDHTRTALIDELNGLIARGKDDANAVRRADEVRAQLKAGGVSADELRRAVSANTARETR